ncbi:MAG: (2Fe-2S) ferredoxin domain-containing protein [Halanaerobiaceae bacterium]
MKSLEELRDMRKRLEKDMTARNDEEMARVIIGMGTCGIAAGARDILKAVSDEINKRDLDVKIVQTGCIGMCEEEPIFDIAKPGEERITYGNLTPDTARQIIVEHLINNRIDREHVIARHNN